ncbi:MAG: hypothetical protein M4D80_28705 [Myxococcota bacterium]|nr:hypothetical protein [Myxococcota bacterium]
MKVLVVVLCGCNLGASVDIDLVGTGHGTVLSSPAGITCGPKTCAMTIESRPTELSPKADGASRFVGWNGYCTGNGDCRVLSTHDVELEARFEVATSFELRIDKIGEGRVVSLEPGIDCGGTCTMLAAPGGTVTLDAIDEPGFTFESWGTACVVVPPGRRCVVTMTQDQVVSVRFVAADTRNVTRVDQLPECSSDGLPSRARERPDRHRAV